MKVAIIFDGNGPMSIGEGHVKQVQRAWPGAEVRFAPTGRDLMDAGFDADVLICWATGGRFSAREYCRYCSNLKWIHCLSAGVEGLMDTTVPDRSGLRVSCAKGIHGIPMSNHVMGYILSFLRRFPEFSRLQREKRWERPMPDDAEGKVLTIIGMGSIGTAVARAAKAFNMTVYGVKRRVDPQEYVDKVCPESELDELLAQSDFVVILLPASPVTTNFMSAERFARMKKGSYFINVGRGQTVDEAALIDALQTGHLAGAALDVANPEPIAPESPLWEMENVIITPHVAADTPKYMERALDVFAKNVPLFLKGEPMVSEIDLEARY